jgi:putative ABC transport system substrate-binding protein
MRRRVFIAGLGSAAAWPMMARAQQPSVSVVGYLSPQSGDDDYKIITDPFFPQGLKENGYVEGQNPTLPKRWPRSCAFIAK